MSGGETYVDSYYRNKAKKPGSVSVTQCQLMTSTAFGRCQVNKFLFASVHFFVCLFLELQVNIQVKKFQLSSHEPHVYESLGFNFFTEETKLFSPVEQLLDNFIVLEGVVSMCHFLQPRCSGFDSRYTVDWV